MTEAAFAFPDELSELLSSEYPPSLNRRSERSISGMRWNAAVPDNSVGVIRCSTRKEVVTALRALKRTPMPISVLSGGHDPFGRSFRAGSVVLDISGLRSVELQGNDTLVQVGGGTRTIDLLQALPGAIAPVTGTIGTVGLAGLVLGGGYGRLTSQCGLAADQLVAAELVLPDGESVHVDASSQPDLLWALKGGGGNFGVVTAMTLRVHTVPRLLSAMVFFTLDHAPRALEVLQGLMDEAPSGLSLFSGFMNDPSGQPILFVAPLWIGNDEQGLALIDRLTTAQGATVINREWTQYRNLFSEDFEKGWPKGRNYSMDVQSVPSLDSGTIEALVSAARTFTSPSSAIVMHDFRGVATDIASDATAFAMRTPHFAIQLVAGWDGNAGYSGDPHREWVRSTALSLAPSASIGSYVSLMADPDGSRARGFYGSSSAALINLRKACDPHHQLSAPGAH